MWIVQIIFIVLNLISAFILHNSDYVGYSGRQEPDPFKMEVYRWLLWGLLSLIPILNIVSFVGWLLYMAFDWSEDHRLRLPKDHWLFKKY